MSTQYDPWAQPPPQGFPAPGEPEAYPHQPSPPPVFNPYVQPLDEQDSTDRLSAYQPTPDEQPPDQSVAPKKPAKIQPLRVIVIILLVIAVVFVAVVVIKVNGGLAGSPAQTTTSTEPTGDSATPGSDSTDTQTPSSVTTGTDTGYPGVVLDDGWVLSIDANGLPSVTGTVTNNNTKAISDFIVLTFNGYDAAGSIVGTCMDATDHVDANGQWDFVAYCSDQTIVSVKFHGIS